MTYEKDKDPYWDPIYILEWSIPGQLFTEKYGTTTRERKTC